MVTLTIDARRVRVAMNRAKLSVLVYILVTMILLITNANNWCILIPFLELLFVETEMGIMVIDMGYLWSFKTTYRVRVRKGK